MNTTQQTRYLTINAGTKHRTGYSPATLTMRVQSTGQRGRNRRAKAKMCKLPCSPELAKQAEETRQKQTANLNRFKVCLTLPVAIDLNNLLAYKGKGTFDGKKPSAKSPWGLMKYRENEDLDNLDNFWQEQAMITDFATGIRRSVKEQEDEFSWVRSIGVSRLAGTPDILPTDLICNRANGWSTSKKNMINDKVVQGKPSFTIDYSVPCFLRSPVFEAYKLLPRDIPGPFNNREVGDKLLTSSDTLSAVSYLATFLTMNQDAAVLAARDNILRAIAFAINHN
eukprot:3400020-Heterocapsa_arctica.AAC.1